MNSANTMTKGERSELISPVKQRERLMKTLAAQRAAELEAELEEQLSAQFSYDDDEIWKAAHAAAKDAVEGARAVIPSRCQENANDFIAQGP